MKSEESLSALHNLANLHLGLEHYDRAIAILAGMIQVFQDPSLPAPPGVHYGMYLVQTQVELAECYK